MRLKAHVGSDDIMRELFFIRFLGLMILIVLLVAITTAITISLANDFGVPLLALDDLAVGEVAQTDDLR